MLYALQSGQQPRLVIEARESSRAFSGHEALQKSAPRMMRRSGVPHERDWMIGKRITGETFVDPEAAPTLHKGARHRCISQMGDNQFPNPSYRFYM